MCGIVAYKGSQAAVPLLLDGLKKLEYRGYDSAGIATYDTKLEAKKGVGKVADVDNKVMFTSLQGTVGIGHTRWATTGGVTEENAHPHLGKRFAIVQNGIVENYQELRNACSNHDFQSETDTEVILAMLEQEASNAPMKDALCTVFGKLHGRNAIVVLDSKTGDLYAARKGSPLVLAPAEHGVFLASDASPIFEHTKNVVFLDDGEFVHIGDTYEIFDAEGKAIEKEVTTVSWSVEQAQKGEHPHFMIKEILEQKHSIHDAIHQDRENIERVATMINDAFGTYVVACGSAAKVALASTYIFSSVAKHHLNFALGSEFPCYHDFLTDKSLLIAISQSGETADTLEAIEVAKAKNGKIVTIVNALGSTMDRIADATIPVHAGPEKAVCSTKAITNQLAIIYLLAYTCVGKYDEGITLLKHTADSVQEMLTDEYREEIRTVANKLIDRESMYIIGRGDNYPVALESAIKIQEVSYVHAEGFAAGELKHGPIALIEEGTPLIVFVPNDETKEDVLTNALEVKARGGMIIGVAPENNEAFDVWIRVPDLPKTSPIVNLIPIQLLAYELSVARGNDVDMPRNLAKSVTVK